MRIGAERDEGDLRNEKFKHEVFNILSWTKKVLCSILSYMGRKCVNITTKHTRNYISYISRPSINDNLEGFSMNTTANFLDDVIDDYVKEERKAYETVRRDLDRLKNLIVAWKKY